MIGKSRTDLVAEPLRSGVRLRPRVAAVDEECQPDEPVERDDVDESPATSGDEAPSLDETMAAADVDLTGVPTAAIVGELNRRARVLATRRARVLDRIEELDRKLEDAADAIQSVRAASHAAPPPRRRAKNSVSLGDAIALAVEVRAQVSPAEAAELVLENGYRSTAQRFGMVVAATLSKDARFKRVGRGLYERVR